MQPLKLELSVICGAVVLFVRTRRKYAGVPILLQIIHFIYIGVFAVIGIAGLYTLLLMLIRHHEYIALFSNPNPFGLAPSFLVNIGYAFAPLGVLIFAAAYKLGDFREWARLIVIRLSLLYSILYFGMMLTASNFVRTMRDVHIAYALTLGLSLFSISAMFFYSSKVVRERLENHES